MAFFIAKVVYAECSDLGQSDCLKYPAFCQWSNSQCEEIGGGGSGENLEGGPYDVLTISEDQGLAAGDGYIDGVLYYPDNDFDQYKSIVFTPGFGGGSTEMSSWAQFFASHGFIAMVIGPNDANNDSHQQRAEGLIDALETLRQEIKDRLLLCLEKLT